MVGLAGAPARGGRPPNVLLASADDPSGQRGRRDDRAAHGRAGPANPLGQGRDARGLERPAQVVKQDARETWRKQGYEAGRAAGRREATPYNGPRLPTNSASGLPEAYAAALDRAYSHGSIGNPASTGWRSIERPQLRLAVAFGRRSLYNGG
jgi:hypothetical protein